LPGVSIQLDALRQDELDRDVVERARAAKNQTHGLDTGN
jgi:hypothetical protein